MAYRGVTSPYDPRSSTARGLKTLLRHLHFHAPNSNGNSADAPVPYLRAHPPNTVRRRNRHLITTSKLVHPFGDYGRPAPDGNDFLLHCGRCSGERCGTRLLGGSADAAEVRAAARRDLRGGGHARPGGPRAHLAGRRLGIDLVGLLIDRYADNVRVHLVHLGGGVSGHIKLIGGRFFDWVAAGKRVYTDTSWAVGFAPRWLQPRSSGAASATTGCCSPATSPGATTRASSPGSRRPSATASSPGTSSWTTSTPSPPRSRPRTRRAGRPAALAARHSWDAAALAHATLYRRLLAGRPIGATPDAEPTYSAVKP